MLQPLMCYSLYTLLCVVRAFKNKNMKIIDKILMIAMGLLICLKISWQTPLPLIGLLPMFYATIYLVKVGIEEDL